MMRHENAPLVCLAGPTAAGKSAAVLALAERWPIEIINVDSATIYRGMDIGTAKPSVAEQARTPQHLLDIRDPAQSYSAAEFCDDAERLIDMIRGRGRIPVLAGGTMLYFKALREGLDDLPRADPELRAALSAQAETQGWPALHAQLARLDPATAARLAPGDSQRIQRALEICMLSGKPMSDLLSRTRPNKDTHATSDPDSPGRTEARGAAAGGQPAVSAASGSNAARSEAGALAAPAAAGSAGQSATPDRSGPPGGIGPASQGGRASRPAPRQWLTLSLEPSDRLALHARIAQRYDAMLQQGLIDEVTQLRRRPDLHPGLPSIRCVGYRQTWAYLEGEIDAETAREQGIAATRQLAKRQLTWLRALPDRHVIDCLRADAVEQVVAACAPIFDRSAG